MSDKAKLFINLDNKAPITPKAPAPKQESTDLKKSVRLYIRIK